MNLLGVGAGWAGQCFPDSRQPAAILLGLRKGSTALWEEFPGWSQLPSSGTEAFEWRGGLTPPTLAFGADHSSWHRFFNKRP